MVSHGDQPQYFDIIAEEYAPIPIKAAWARGNCPEVITKRKLVVAIIYTRVNIQM
jgi:hypothetical protein